MARALQASLEAPYYLVRLDAPGFDTWLADCVKALRDLPVLFVGVH